MPSERAIKIVIKSVKVAKKEYAFRLQLGVVLDKSNPLEKFIPFSLLNEHSSNTSVTTPLIREGLSWNPSTCTLHVPKKTTSMMDLSSGSNMDCIVCKDEFQLCLHKLKGSDDDDDGDSLPSVYHFQVDLDSQTNLRDGFDVVAKFSKTATFKVWVQEVDIEDFHPEKLADLSQGPQADTLQSLAAAVEKVGVALQLAEQGTVRHKYLGTWRSALLGVCGNTASAFLQELPGGAGICGVIGTLFHAVVSEGECLEAGVEICNDVASTLKVIAHAAAKCPAFEHADHVHTALERFVELVRAALSDLQAFQRIRGCRYWKSTVFLERVNKYADDLRHMQTTLKLDLNLFMLAEVHNNLNQLPPQLRYLRADEVNRINRFSTAVLLPELQHALRDIYEKRVKQSAVAHISMTVNHLTPVRIRMMTTSSSSNMLLAGDATIDSTDVISLLIAQKKRSLLVEGPAGIGKTTWVHHLAATQALSNGVVIPIHLGELARYLSNKTTDETTSLSPRELIFVSLGGREAHADLVDKIYFGAQRYGWNIVFMFDGPEEVTTTSSQPEIDLYQYVMKEVIHAVEASDPLQNAPPHLFGTTSVVVLVSREGRVAQRAQNTAFMVPWCTTEANMFIAQFFRAQQVRENIMFPHPTGTSASEKNNDVFMIQNIVDELRSVIESQRFGAFLTHPVALEALCYCKMIAPDKPIASISELMRRSVTSKLEAAHCKYGSDWTSSQEVLKRCKRLAMTTGRDGNFFDLDPTDPVDRDVMRSGLVRSTTTGRFVDLPFLQYFQALHVSTNLSLLSSTDWDCCSVPLIRCEDSLCCVLYAARDTVVCLRNLEHNAVTIELTVEIVRKRRDVCVRWCCGSSFDRAYDSLKHGLHAEKRTVEPKSQTTMQIVLKQTEYCALSIHGTDSRVVAVQCTWRDVTSGSEHVNLPQISQWQPFFDIPVYRQQTTFFQILADLIRAPTNGPEASEITTTTTTRFPLSSIDDDDAMIHRSPANREMMTTYLLQRLQYHHQRAASLTRDADRSLVSTSFPNILATAAGSTFANWSSKASVLAQMGLTIVTQCASVLLPLSARSTFGAMLAMMTETQHFFGRVLEFFGIRPKAVFEWALLPCAIHGGISMWLSLTERISKWRKALLFNPRGAFMNEALIASYTNGTDDIAQHLKSAGARINFMHACSLGATKIVREEVYRMIQTKSQTIDEDVCPLLRECMTHGQIGTIAAIVELLASSSASSVPLPNVCDWIISSILDGNSPSGVSTAGRDGLIRCVALLLPSAKEDSTLYMQLEELALRVCPLRSTQHLVIARILTMQSLLSATRPFLEDNVNQQTFLARSAVGATIAVSNASIDARTYSREFLSCVRDCCEFSSARSLKLTELDENDAILRKVLTPSNQTLKELHLDGCKLPKAATFPPNIETLVLSNSTVSDVTAVSIKKLMSLSCLTINGTASPNQTILENIACTSLKSLSVSNQSNLKGLSVCTAVWKSQNLLSLRIDNSVCFSNDDICRILRIPTLTSLDLANAVCLSSVELHADEIAPLVSLRLGSLSDNFHDGTARPLAAIKTLTSLQITGKGITGGSCIAHFCQLKLLTVLSLAGCTSVVGVAGVMALQTMISLTSLNINDCTVTNVGLLELSNLPCTLRELSAANTGCTDEGLTHIAKIKSLTYLSVARNNISDKGVSHMKAMKDLSTLVLDECCAVTSAGVLEFARSMRSLQSLSMAKCTKVDNGDGFRRIPKMETLTSLNFSGCENMTLSAETCLLLSQSRSLVSLDLSGCSLSRDALEALSSSKSIVTLAICGCRGVTEEHVDNFFVHNKTTHVLR